MRILILSHMYPNQMNEVYGIFVFNQVQELMKLGHEVRVISPVPWAGGPLLLKKKWRQYRDIPDFEVRQGVRVYYPRYPVLPGRLFLHFSGWAYYLAAREAVKKISNDFAYDLIHAHVALPDGFAAIRIAGEKPVVLTIHGVDIFRTIHLNKKCRRAVIDTLNGVDRVVAVSSKLKREMEELMPKEKIHVIPNGIIPEQAVNDCALLKKEYLKKDVLLTVAYLIERKGHRYVLEALKLLVPEFPNIMYLIIGDGVEEENLKKLSRELDLEKHVMFLGRKSSPEVMKYMSLCNVFVLPSWNEAFGVVYLEAMVHGKPVVGCMKEGIEDVVLNGVNGILVPARDHVGLAGALRRLLSDREYAVRMGQEGQKTVLERFTWAQVAMELEKIYHILLEKS